MRICLQAVVVDRISARIRTSLPVPADNTCLSSALNFQEPVAQPRLRILLPSFTRGCEFCQTRQGETLILPRNTCLICQVRGDGATVQSRRSLVNFSNRR